MEEDLKQRKCIITSANEKYIPYLAVLLSSVMQNTECGDKYEFVVLHDNLSQHSQAELLTMIKNENIEVRFLNVHLLVEGYDFFVSGSKNQAYLSKEAYFRLLAPELLPEYDIALYLDCDTIVCPGWSSIFNINLDDYILAGVPDIWGNWECYDQKSQIYKYRQEELELSNPLRYFNSGMMLFNLKMMRSLFEKNKLLEIAVSKEWKKHDQDVLNYLCKDKVLFLDYSWNLIECPGKRAWNATADEECMEYEESLRNPKIIHFASRKPWIVKGVYFEQRFWNSAVQTPYFDKIFTTFIQEQLQQGECFEEKAYASIRSGKIGVRFIIKCILTWIKKNLHI